MRHTKQLLQMISGLVKHPHNIYVMYMKGHIYLRVEIVRYSDGQLMCFTSHLPEDQIEHSSTNDLINMWVADFNDCIMSSYRMEGEIAIH